MDVSTSFNFATLDRDLYDCQFTLDPVVKNGRRIFFVRIPRYAHNVLGRLEAVKQAFMPGGEYEASLNVAFHNLHQRSAQSNQVVTTHKAAAATVKAVVAKVEAARREAFEISLELPFIQGAVELEKSLSALIEIEVAASCAERLGKELDEVLSNDSHQATLEYYKKWVKECDGIALLADPGQKIARLEQIVKELFRADACIKGADLYKELLEYALYVVGCIEKEVAGSHIKTLIEQRVKAVQRTLSNVLQITGFSELDKATLCYLTDNESETIALPNENYFRNGQWGVWYTYGAIKEQYTALQNVAKALYRLQREVEASIRTLCCTEEQLKQHATIVRGLKQAIINERIALESVPLTNKVHAGWYYAGGLFAHASYIETLLEVGRAQLSASTQGYIRALSATVSYLKEPTIERLYSALQACSAVGVEDAAGFRNMAIYRAIDQTLARRGAQTIAWTREEQEVPRQLEQESIEWTILPDHIKSYLMKGFLRHIHFLQERDDPVFDRAYIAFSVSKGFSRVLEENSLFKALHEAYLQ